MLSQLSIPNISRTRSDGGRAPFDHEALFTIGLQHVERLSRRIWNDYNVHDPGITTLELLAYAITDLSYRASLPVADLLASPEGNAEAMASRFFTARRILPNRALTIADYRKLLIDVPGVHNAWVLPSVRTYYADTIEGQLLAEYPEGAPGIVAVSPAGLFEVVLEYTDDITDEAGRAAVNEAVCRRLQANRNLCEDFVSVAGVPTQNFVLCAELELAPDADVAAVHAEILFQTQEYLAPPVRQRSLSEMLARTDAEGNALTIDAIFDGPALDHGFIPDEELAASELRSEIRLSDIISIVMDIPGVLAVRDIVIHAEGAPVAPENKWVVPVLPGRKALLSRDLWRLVSYKRGMPFTPERAVVDAAWLALAERDAKHAEAYDCAIPLGTYRALNAYTSVQNHFPEVYGIGPVGLGGAADERRHAQADQLKGYLLFFDQIMADYLAQLSHAADLFSTDPALERTYFHQLVDSFTGYERIYGVAPEDVTDTLADDVDDAAAGIDRRNRFLDHLIARFAERFHDFVYTMHNEFGYTDESMIAYKCRFLSEYPEISCGRSTAYDHSLRNPEDLWDSANISGFERRLGALLGIADTTRRDLSDSEGMYLIENILLRPLDPDDLECPRGSAPPLAPPAPAPPAPADSGELSPGAPPDPIVGGGDPTDPGAGDVGDPALGGDPPDPFLPICPDPNCTTCYAEDPYSYRMHIILPAYGARFGDIDFRRWAEGVIREETPAHILPKICWISREDMLEFESLYRDWIYLRSGADTTDRFTKLTNFISALFRVKNVYPINRLNECESVDVDTTFILGRSALGTMH